MKVKWSEAARDDRRAIIDYLAERDVAAALKTDERLLEAIRLLEQYPFAARQGRVAGTRELVIPDTRLIAVYRVDISTPVIVRLIHTSRNWPPRDD